METPVFLTRQQLAARWRCGLRTVDRRRTSGRLRWLDLGDGDKPLVRFRLTDVEAFEEGMVRGCDPEPVGEIVGRLMESPEALIAAAQTDDRRTE